MDRNNVALRGIGLVILAAGASARLGRPKQLLAFQGESLLRRAADAAVRSGCRPIVVVLGAYGSRCALEVRGLPVRMVENPRWREGIGASLGAGVAALTAADPEVGAIVIAVCDQPYLSTDTIRSLVDTHRASGSPIVASEYEGIVGVPALFDRTLFDALTSLGGSEGARHVIARHRDSVRCVPFPGGGLDIDTPDDYAALVAPAGAARLAGARDTSGEGGRGVMAARKEG